jgi:hypothetical protein
MAMLQGEFCTQGRCKHACFLDSLCWPACWNCSQNSSRLPLTTLLSFLIIRIPPRVRVAISLDVAEVIFYLIIIKFSAMYT